MKKENISQIITRIDDTYIAEAARSAAENRPEAGGEAAVKSTAGKRSLRRFGLLAACLAAVLLLGTGAFALRAEAKEYEAAVLFFEENGLSAEGLSRTEVKAVYRDITTNSFTYGKTAEVIRQAVPGWEIAQNEASPEELAKRWARKDWIITDEVDPADDPRLGAGIRFLIDHQGGGVDREGKTVPYKGILSCYRDRELIWTAVFTQFNVGGWAYHPEGTIVWGMDYSFVSGGPDTAWIACVDEAGSIRWQHPLLSHGFSQLQIGAVLKNDDGSLAVLGRGDLKYLCLTTLDKDGKELSFRKTEVGNRGLWNAARLGDGYLIQLGSYNTGEYASLVRMDREGNITGEFSYEGEDCVYHLTGMAEFGGQIYLSAYAVPLPDKPGYGREEIANILDHIFSMGEAGFNISSEELTPLVKDNYPAMLLICDPEAGTAQTFYSVNGSIGDALSVNAEGRLEWSVKRIDSAEFSPATNAFSIICFCRLFRYTFETDGTLSAQLDTGEPAQYLR